MEKIELKKLYYQMAYIRIVEEKIAAVYPQQEMRCPVHLCIGQEAIAAGVCSYLTHNDFVLSNHRAHGHYLAKGGNLVAMLAEIYGKTTGCAKGRGGSMHLIDLAVNFLGSTPIVGNIIPVATGVAFAQKLKKKKNVTVVFFGDAVVEEGVFGEALNFAQLKRLPIIYVCENNLYSVYTHLRDRQPKRVIANIAKGYGVKTLTGDGNDIFKVLQIMKNARKIVAKNNGPVFIELSTYRWREHCGPNYDNDLGYRTEAEFRKWKKLDPIARFKKYAIAKRIFTNKDFQKIDSEIFHVVEIAIKKAKQSVGLISKLTAANVYAE